MELAKIKVEPYGPGAADHNMPCAICHTNHAVLDMNAGVYQPCWKCQGVGYRISRSSGFWRDLAAALFGTTKQIKREVHH